MKKYIRSLLFLFSIAGLCGCCINYTLKGSNLSKDIKTVSIAYIENKADIVAPSLSQVMTEKLKNKFARESSLKVVNENGDIQFSGTISSYVLSNAAQQGNSQIASNRLTITVQMKCVNTKDTTQSYNQAFTNFNDFPSSQTLSNVESKLINDISDLLVQEMFNKAVINW